MIYMGRNTGRPLVDAKFEAWDYGPVLPSLYRKLKMFGASAVEDIFSARIKEDSRSASIIRQVAKHYANKRAGDLVAMTHREGGAWANNYVPGAKGVIIPDAEILAEYRSRVA